jgi:hypothetical protein
MIEKGHQLYCQLTGQSLRLAFDRERMWYELLRVGYSLEDLRTFITYPQREIRARRRNVGALKLSNLLQPDRFEEDLQISRVRLHPLPSSKTKWRGNAGSTRNPPWICGEVFGPQVNSAFRPLSSGVSNCVSSDHWPSALGETRTFQVPGPS